MDGFPYPPRPGQKQLVQAIKRHQRRNGHVMIESATGTGKTVCALHASIETALQDGRRIIYATRTNSQQAQIIKEHGALDADTLAVPMMGRKQYCPLLKDDPRFQEGTSEELGRLCRAAKQKAMQAHATGQDVEGACPYFRRLLEDGPGPVEALLRSHDGGLAALHAAIAGAGSCAYEAFKLLLSEAHVVVVPYVFVIDGRLRQALMQWMGTTPEACHLIIDEAHNLPESTRGHHSPRLGLATVERALREAERLQDPVLGGTTLASTFLTALHRALRDLVHEHAADAEDGWMPPEALDEALMSGLQLSGPAVARVVRDMDAWGEAVREQKRERGKLPRSYLGAVAAFLRLWQEARDAPYVHLAIRTPRPALEAYLLEPAARLSWLHEMASTTHMSGTLAPFAAYQSEAGLPKSAKPVTIDGGLAPDQLRTYGMIGSIRSHRAIQEDPAVVATHQESARAVLARWRGRTGLWFPSHKMLHDDLEEGLLHGLDVSLHVEAPDMSTPDLLALVARFLADDHPMPVLVGVLGGRLTEGIDYPGEAMEQALLMAVPYPRPSARSQALIHHYDVRSDNGWQVAVHGPVGRTLRQAVGRLVRGPDDHGTAVVLDERMMRFRDRFPDLAMIQDVHQVGSPIPDAHQGFINAAAYSDPRPG